MLTYILFTTQSMLLSATSKMGQPNADSQTVQSPEHALVSDKQKGQPDTDLQAVQNADHTLSSNKQEEPARC